MPTDALPLRYAAAPRGPRTFLQGALETAPDQALALLDLVGWQEPLPVVAHAYASGDGLRAHRTHVHPLSCVARTGRLDWFERALALALEDAKVPLYLEKEDGDLRTPTDWVGCRVLHTVAAEGTVAHLEALLAAMDRHPGSLRYTAPHIERNPWKDLGRGDRTRPPAHWKGILTLLEHRLLQEVLPGMPPGTKPKPPSRRTQREREAVQQAHTYALTEAAALGHPALCTALVDLGLATVTMAAVGGALEAGGSDLALHMLRSGRLLPARATTRAWPEATGADQVLEAFATALRRWDATDRPLPPSLTPADAQMQRQATLDALGVFLSEMARLRAEPAFAPALTLGRGAGALTPGLVRLDAEALGDLPARALALDWPLPTWRDWCTLLAPEHADSPWTALQRDRLAACPAERLEPYLLALAQQASDDLTAPGHVAAVARVRDALWAHLPAPPLTAVAWITQAAARLLADMPEEAAAALKADWLAGVLAPTPARRGVRL